MSDVLEQILESRRKSLEKSKIRRSIRDLEGMILGVPAPLDFKNAINRPGEISVIAEMKKKSPSAGMIRPEYSVSKIAEAYKKGGARALSVLTEEDFFGGEILDLQRAKDASELPILRKDFIFDPYQIAEARAYGADAILLIADMLDPGHLNDLVDCALEYRVEPLVEVFTPSVLEAVLQTKARIVGINNRNLRTLEMLPDNVENLSRLIPSDRVVVAESGIKKPEEISALRKLPVRAVLVGESLLKQPDLEVAVRKLVEAA